MDHGPPPFAVTRICKTTGLGLVPSCGQATTRLAKIAYGPMSPLLRVVGEDPGSWGRFDVPGHRTIYSASPVAASYAEALAVFRTSGLSIPLQQLFPDTPGGHGPQTLLEQVAKEWSEDQCIMPLGSVPAGWRHDRLEYPITLPPTGWFVNIEDSNTLAALNDAIAQFLHPTAASPAAEFTRAGVLDNNRVVTTLLAEWVHGQVLDDGELPHGIVFGSKHGSDYNCVAVWLRAVDDGKSLTSEPTKSGTGLEVKKPEHNEPLKTIAEQFHLFIH